MPKLVIDVAMEGVKCCLVTFGLHYHSNPSECLAVPVHSLLKVPKMLSVFSLMWGSCMRIPSLTSDRMMLMLRHAAQFPSQYHSPPPRPPFLPSCWSDGVCCFSSSHFRQALFPLALPIQLSSSLI